MLRYPIRLLITTMMVPSGSTAASVPPLPVIAAYYRCVGSACTLSELRARRSDTVRGTVRTLDDRPLADAVVAVTMAPDRVVLRTVTRADGHFEVVLTGGQGDYLVTVTAIGWQPYRQRLTRASTDTVFTLDVRLRPLAQQLATVQIGAALPRPQRGGSEVSTEPAAAARAAEGVPAAVALGDQGSIAALAATVPGLLSSGTGVSAFGLSPDQNQTTLNGLPFAGTDLPRDARVRARVSTSTYDPSRGEFSGAQIALELAPGDLFSNRWGHLTIDSPTLQGRSRPTNSTLNQYQNLRASAGADGELIADRWYYNASAQLSARSTYVGALNESLQQRGATPGASADAVERMLRAAMDLQVPVTAIDVPVASLTDRGAVLLGRLDRTPYAPSTIGVTAYVRLLDSDGAGLSTLTTTSAANRTRLGSMSLQGLYSRFFGDGNLNELRIGGSVQSVTSRPRLALPSVQLAAAGGVTDSDSSAAGFAAFYLGGSLLPTGRSRQSLVQFQNETQWNRWNRGRRPHRPKVTVQARLESVTSQTDESAGSYAFPSIEAFARNAPSVFQRTIGTATPEAGLWSMSMAVGDLWRLTPRLQLVYGARVDGGGFVASLPDNRAVPGELAIHPRGLPGSWAVSPRLGFDWIYRTDGTNQPGARVGQLGTQSRPPRSVLRGGVGRFRSAYLPTLLQNALTSTGRADAPSRVTCIGDAIPRPEWSAWSAGVAPLPTGCADGTAGYSDLRRDVALVARHARPADSWRGSLTWFAGLGRLAWSLEGTLTATFGLPSVVDRNLAAEPAFLVTGEARPVYVPPSAVVPATGALVSEGARRSTALGRVLELESNGRAQTQRVTLTLAPQLTTTGATVSGSYTWSNSLLRQRGGEGGGFGDPRQWEWAPAELDARHQFQLQGGVRLPRGAALTLFGRVLSGAAYTPIVAQDVNGDGVAGDRAFIFAPDAAPTVDSGDALRRLLASNGSAADCLTRQLGRAATRGSCMGRWTTVANAQLAAPGSTFGLSDRVSVALFLSNLPALVDRVVHGSSGLRGWGAPGRPDPVLYTVDGFDPTSRRFSYAVNPAFGRVDVTRSPGAPYALTLDVRINLGRPYVEQQLERAVRAGRGGRAGPRLTGEAIAQRYARTVPDVYGLVLVERDSLLLSADQVAALQAERPPFRAQVDSIWRELGEYLAAMPDAYDRGAALDRSGRETAAVLELSRQASLRIREVVSPIQLPLLPRWVQQLMDAAPGSLRDPPVFSPT